MPRLPLNLPAILGKGASALEREAAEAAAREAGEAGAREAELLGREALPSTELRPAKLGDEAIDASFSHVDDAAKLAPEAEATVAGGSNALRNTAVLGGAGLIGAGLYDMATRKPEITPTDMAPKTPAAMAPQEAPEPTPEPQTDPYSNLMKRFKDDSGLRGRLEKLAFGDIKRPEIKQMDAPKEISLDVGGKTFGGAEDLQRSQDSQNLLTSFANANDGIQKGLSQAFRTQVGNSGDGLRADAKSIDDQFKQKQANQDKDPNSAASQMMRQQARNLGLANVSDNLTAEQIGKVLPQLKAQMDKRQEVEKFNIDTQNKMGEKQFEVDSRRADRATMGLSMLDRRAESQANAQDKAQAKAEMKDTDRLDKLNKTLTSEVASGRSAFGVAAKKLQSIQAVKALTAGRDPNSLDSREITEVARVLDSVLSSGQPTVAGMKKLIPESARGDIAKLAEYITNNRQAVLQGDFVKQFLKTLDREEALAGKQIQDTQSKLLGSYKDLEKKMPEKYQDVLKAQGLDKETIERAKNNEPFTPKKTVAKAGYNPNTGETQVVYTDGSKEVTKKKVEGVDYSRYNR